MHGGGETGPNGEFIALRYTMVETLGDREEAD
jgi:hypothetical protein